MFTGLVETRAEVRKVQRMRIWVATPRGWRVARGRSVAVSGACLTTVTGPGRELVFDLSEETLARTWFGRLKSGSEVNLERAMRLSDRLDGHLVSGHVDGKGKVVGIEGETYTFEVESGLERYLVDKGSVAVDGVSLTVVGPRKRRFSVAVIPETKRKTTLGRARKGDFVNIECDLLAKWVERLSH